MSENTTYTRGTRTTRVKTARLAQGDRVLTEAATRWATDPETGRYVTYMQDNGLQGIKTEPVGPDRVQAAQTKTAATIRTVDRIEPIFHVGGSFRARTQRTYTVHFTDGTRSTGNAPIYTWHALAD